MLGYCVIEIPNFPPPDSLAQRRAIFLTKQIKETARHISMDKLALVKLVELSCHLSMSFNSISFWDLISISNSTSEVLKGSMCT